MDDLIDFTPELREEAMKLVSKYRMGPMFTPPVVSKIGWPDRRRSRTGRRAGPTGRADRTIPRRTCCTCFRRRAIALAGLVPPPGPKDVGYGVCAGQATASCRSGSGGHGAPPPPRVAGTDPRRRRWRGGGATDGSGACHCQAAVWAHHGASIWTRAKSCGRWRMARRRTTSRTIRR